MKALRIFDSNRKSCNSFFYYYYFLFALKIKTKTTKNIQKYRSNHRDDFMFRLFQSIVYTQNNFNEHNLIGFVVCFFFFFVTFVQSFSAVWVSLSLIFSSFLFFGSKSFYLFLFLFLFSSIQSTHLCVFVCNNKKT